MRSGWCELCFYIEFIGIVGGWIWEMRRRKVKSDRKIFGLINRVWSCYLLRFGRLEESRFVGGY